jgi:hypothetical protein
MENNYYQIYIDATLALAQSLVIKSSNTADAINIKLSIDVGPNAVDRLRPQTWKYYLNVSGQYHETDTLMQVVSLDTLQTIDFTRQTLQHHRATAKAYAFGTTLYKELVNRFPNQERLILGILYPCDINTAITASDGTILSYPPHLVESTEYGLINNLQTWIYGYLARWHNPQFTNSDNLYSTAMLGVLYLNLVPALLMLRERACQTNEVHSYHLKQYLASHGMLDSYLLYLTRSQALFLYRNIRYIERNSGKTSVFEWLTQHIMTDRGLPLAGYEMRHDLSLMPDSLVPIAGFKKNPLNTKFNFDLVDDFSLEQIFDKQAPLARDNEKYREEEINRSAKALQYSISNELDIKLLESTVIDYSGSEHYRLSDILLYHWLYLSNTNHYRAYIGFNSPVTEEYIVLTVKEAFEFYVYASCAAMGIVFNRIPSVVATRVIRTPKPTVADLRSVVDHSIITEEFAAQMVDVLPIPQPMISVESFYQYCTELHRQAMHQYHMVSFEEESYERGLKHNLMSRCWADVGVVLGDEPNQFYADWFARRNIAIDEYNLSHLTQVAVTILEKATGVDSSASITLKDIQQAMIRLMGKLSSYGVHYTADINTGPIIDAPCATIRPDNQTGYGTGLQEYVSAVTVLSSNGLGSHEYELDIGSRSSDQIVSSSFSNRYELEINVKPQFDKGGPLYKMEHPIKVGLSYDKPDLGSNPRGLLPVLGMDQFASLSLEDQLSIPNTWV